MRIIPQAFYKNPGSIIRIVAAKHKPASENPGGLPEILHVLLVE
jgi:hypothetical protein